MQSQTESRDLSSSMKARRASHHSWMTHEEKGMQVQSIAKELKGCSEKTEEVEGEGFDLELEKEFQRGEDEEQEEGEEGSQQSAQEQSEQNMDSKDSEPASVGTGTWSCTGSGARGRLWLRCS